MTGSELSIKKNGDKLCLCGDLDLHHFQQAKKLFKEAITDNKTTIIDLAGLTKLDTAGALFLYNNATKQHIKLKNLHPEHEELFKLVKGVNLKKPKIKTPLPSYKKAVISIGKAVITAWLSLIEFISFTGQSILELVKALRHPSTLRFTSITHHIKVIGIDAIPIVSIIAFVISIVIAYQGQIQLKPLGVKNYTVNLITISILREMGGLLTAIMVAGRSGSSFTAEIGVMKVRQEVAALHAMGFNPFNLLVLPRLIALLIALPLLTILANIIGLLGGAAISVSLLDISFPEYVERAHNAATWEDFIVGMIKAPIFAFIIALVGCMHGLKISKSAESVGKETTTSVVKAIFLILILDGLFSIYFEKVGL